jgi:hypothetical protein
MVARMTNDPEPPDDDVISFEASDIPHVLSQIARLGEGLKAEFDLITGRMSWLVIAESFIFSAFACPPQLRIDLISVRSRKQWWGNLPAHAIPPVLLLVWVVALVIALLHR